MSYKCRICGSNDVEHSGDICELCAIGQDPYASAMQGNLQSNSQGYVSNNFSNSYTPSKGKSRKVLIGGGASIANTDPYGNSIVPDTEEDSVQVYQAGQVPNVQQTSTVVNASGNSTTNTSVTKGNSPITYGITKNITTDTQQKSFLEKWFASLFHGIPFSMDDDVIMFQVFPDYTGTALNAMGNACDQVIVYGKLGAGAIAENNEVEVFGYRDSNNNVIAKVIKNKASGTTITPNRSIPAVAIWIITILIFAFFCGMAMGVEWIIGIFILVVCLINYRLVIKILKDILRSIFSMFRRMF